MAKEYEIVVGLEVHAELNTKTKIFCGCRNEFGDEPNINVCPVCMAMPGTLPVLNDQVVDYAIKMGHATNGTINRICKFDRKHYFYPDLTKAYQISQFDVPISMGGYVDVPLNGGKDFKRIRINHIHMEEDAGKLVHDESASGGSLCDFNRCGVPLLEIVSEPDMRSAEETKAYLDTIKSILSYLDISDCNMHEGSIRCDVNVSVMPKGSKEFGTRVEMKNVNSFSAAMRAVEYESARHIEVLEDGGHLVQETRRWDDANGISIPMRSKENAQDYRYFPDTDLPTVVVEQEHVDELKASLPELPIARLKRYMEENSLPYADAQLLVDNMDKADFFDKAVKIGSCQPKSLSNQILGDISRILNEKGLSINDCSLTPQMLVTLVQKLEKSEISSAAGKTVLEEIIFTGKDPAAVIEEKGLAQISDTSFLDEIVKQVLEANPKAVEDYKKGKTNVVGFLVGQCMKASKGQGNPEILKTLIEKAMA